MLCDLQQSLQSVEISPCGASGLNYCSRANIPEADLGKELLSLIEDGPFRIANNLGLVEEGDYKEILKENPDTIEAALLLAHRHESVELAHKHL